MDPPTGDEGTHLIVALLDFPTDFWTHPIACLFARVPHVLKIP